MITPALQFPSHASHPPRLKESTTLRTTTGYQTAQAVSMRNPQSKSPPQRAPSRAPSLSPREGQVLEQILRHGSCDKTICAVLGISHSRCRDLVGRLLRKYQVGTRLELAARFLNLPHGTLDASIKTR